MTPVHVTLRIDGRYCIAFYFMTMLYASLHELVHHFAGFLACGAWGIKTFNYFTTACEGTTGAYMAALAGPVFTFAMMYVGWWFLARRDASILQRQMGFALIFAQLPLQRITCPLMRLNDEHYVAAHYFGDTPQTLWATFLAITAICAPPLVAAWRAIANRRRALWFLFYLVLFPYLVWGPVFGGLEYLLVHHQVLDGRWIGVAHLFWLNEVVTLFGHWFTGGWFHPRSPSGLSHGIA